MPLYQLKADFFKTLGHPVRIRVLELLGEREHTSSALLAYLNVEAPYLSHQLSVLRRAHLVVFRKEGPIVHYALADPEVTQLLRVARAILAGAVAESDGPFADPREQGPRADWPNRTVNVVPPDHRRDGHPGEARST
jgi:ArsR family transcriptional regulator